MGRRCDGEAASDICCFDSSATRFSTEATRGSAFRIESISARLCLRTYLKIWASRSASIFMFTKFTSFRPDFTTRAEACQKGGRTTKNLAFMRERAKLTQRELADVLGVERSTVAKWESGAAYPRASQLPALAKALSCSIDELYTGEEAAT